MIGLFLTYNTIFHNHIMIKAYIRAINMILNILFHSLGIVYNIWIYLWKNPSFNSNSGYDEQFYNEVPFLKKIFNVKGPAIYSDIFREIEILYSLEYKIF